MRERASKKIPFIKKESLLRGVVGSDLQPPHVYAGQLRAMIVTPRGVRRIVKVIHCFTLACIVMIGFLPVLKAVFDLSLFFVSFLLLAFLLVGYGLFLLANGMHTMKRWALFSFWGLSLVLCGGYVYRIDLAIHMQEFVLPIINMVILVCASTYLIQPTIRTRFTR